MFKFQAKSELEVLNLLPKGEYQYIVKECVECVSKNGNPQLKATLEVYNDSGRPKKIIDFLSEEFMEYKLRHFLITLLGEEKYNQQEINPIEVVGKSGVVKIYIKEDKTGQYAPQNAVIDYLPIDSVGTFKDALTNKADSAFDDAIPF